MNKINNNNFNSKIYRDFKEYSIINCYEHIKLVNILLMIVLIFHYYIKKYKFINEIIENPDKAKTIISLLTLIPPIPSNIAKMSKTAKK
jgi:hypothetical protein